MLELSREATFSLGRLKVFEVRQRLPTLELSATAYVDGYIVRVVSEQMRSENCCAVSTKPMCNHPLRQLTRKQDRGGLLYPSDELVHVIDALKEFVDISLREHPRLAKPLAVLLRHAVPAVASSPLMRCAASKANAHRTKFSDLVCTRFIRPLLVNYAFIKTNKHDVYKSFAKEPLSRKYLKL